MDNPHIAEFSGFMTVLEGKPIGFVSWNPTNLPESTEIGHNCILTQYKGNGRCGRLRKHFPNMQDQECIMKLC